MGARGVNNVASKLLMALFPPNAPFLKMEVDDMTATEMTAQPGLADEVNRAFGQFVRRVMTDVEARALRADLYEYFRLEVVTGNVTLYVPEEGRSRVYRLDRYVAKRDPAGNLLEWIGLDKVARATLPEDIANAIPAGQKSVEGATVADELVDLYTYVYLTEDGSYAVHQEVEEVLVNGSEGTFPKDRLPYIVGRYAKVDGEDYGRSLVEEYLGDLSHMESLSKSIREFVAIASRVIPIIRPNSTISPKRFVEAANGEPLSGDPEDIHFLQIERYNDFRVAKEMLGELAQGLAFAFLLNTAIQRPGERVTAEEIRYMARELEDTLGGAYSLQSMDLQLPLANILIGHLEARRSLPELPKGLVQPRVVTGMDALGRGNDLSNLMQFIQIIGETPAAQTVKWEGLAMRVANGLNVETEGLLMSPEEIAAQQQQAMMQQMADRLGPNIVNQVGGMAQKSMEAPSG